jgi:hypothetical protein
LKVGVCFVFGVGRCVSHLLYQVALGVRLASQFPIQVDTKDSPLAHQRAVQRAKGLQNTAFAAQLLLLTSVMACHSAFFFAGAGATFCFYLKKKSFGARGARQYQRGGETEHIHMACPTLPLSCWMCVVAFLKLQSCSRCLGVSLCFVAAV